MVNAMVLLKVERDKVSTIAEALAGLRGISEVYSVAGRYDLAVIIRVGSNDELASIITEKMLKVNGIIDSETLISFRVYSKHDLENIFSFPEK